MRAVHFLWSEEYGACDECSLPAAFFGIDGYGPGRPMRLCAICAANLACDGLTIARIDAAEWGYGHDCEDEDDAGRLARLEAEFASRGGRGVDLADEIDAIRARRSES